MPLRSALFTFLKNALLIQKRKMQKVKTPEHSTATDPACRSRTRLSIKPKKIRSKNEDLENERDARRFDFFKAPKGSFCNKKNSYANERNEL